MECVAAWNDDGDWCHGARAVKRCDEYHGNDLICRCDISGTSPPPATQSPPPANRSVRLGSDGFRAEIFYNGQWGTICDDSFDRNDAIVFCRTLGYNHGEVVSNSVTQDGPSSMPINADDLRCDGSESSIFNCSGSWGSHNCGHSEDVGVECTTRTQSPTQSPTPSPTPPTLKCENTFSDLQDVCDQTSNYCDLLVNWNGTHVYNNNTCNGYCEAHGMECIAGWHGDGHSCNVSPFVSGISSNGCDEYHGNDLICRCDINVLSARGQPMVRIGSDGFRAEILWDGQWGTICDDHFGTNDAIVFCRTLGFMSGEVVAAGATQDGNSWVPINADDLRCDGSEGNIFHCNGNWGSHNCQHSEDVGVRCFS